MALHNTYIQAVDVPAPLRDISSAAICDGVADDIEIQAALDGLDSSGGVIVLSAGTFTLSAPVARAIDHVTIQGAGPSTIINYNGTDPVISAGVQATWVLRDFKTDAGGVDISTAVNPYTSYWKAGLHTSSTMVSAVIYSFTETAGAGTYTANYGFPPGSTILDVRWSNQAVWTAATSATLNVGDDDDPDAYFDAVDVKAAPIADVNGAGGISSFLGDTGAGLYAKLTKYSSALKSITATVVTVGATGNAGRSRLTILYCGGPGYPAEKA